MLPDNIDPIRAEVRKGTVRDAILFSVGVNDTHGKRRSNADKRAAVLTLLQDEEWGKWSNNAIRKVCGVSLDLVNRTRDSLNESLSEDIAFQCPVCAECFSAEVWHCDKCAHHWPTSGRDHCANCHKGKPAKCRTSTPIPAEEARELTRVAVAAGRTYTTKHGTVATMNTAKIGNGSAKRKTAIDSPTPTFTPSTANPVRYDCPCWRVGHLPDP